MKSRKLIFAVATLVLISGGYLLWNTSHNRTPEGYILQNGTGEYNDCGTISPCGTECHGNIIHGKCYVKKNEPIGL